jgi:hypothetical protein
LTRPATVDFMDLNSEVKLRKKSVDSESSNMTAGKWKN